MPRHLNLTGKVTTDDHGPKKYYPWKPTKRILWRKLDLVTKRILWRKETWSKNPKVNKIPFKKYSALKKNGEIPFKMMINPLQNYGEAWKPIYKQIL